MRKATWWVLAVHCVVMVSACQTAPTKITETPQSAWSARLTEDAKKPLKLTDDMVVLDARSEFDYGLSHWSASIHFTWNDLGSDSQKPWLLVTPREAAQKLSLLGIGPKTPVLVIGYGPKGHGEEGRLAWTLIYFGVENVQTVSVDGLDVYFTHQQTPERKNISLWDSQPREEMAVDHADFLKAAQKVGLKSVHILDVRSKDEYFNRNAGKYDTPDLHAMNIDWREFFGEDGRPQKSVQKKLRGVGIKQDDQIIVISNEGTRSGAASYALMASGFKHVQNFLQGWNSLVQ